MKSYHLFFALIVLTFLAACGGAPRTVVVAATASPAAPPTVGVNALQTQAAASIFATQTAAIPTADVKSLQTQAAISIFATQTVAAASAATPTPTTSSSLPPPPAETTAPSPLPPAIAATGGSAGFISGVVLATGTQGDNLDPVGLTTSFSPDATIHAVVTIVDAPDNSNVKAEWYVVDVGSAASPNSLISEYAQTAQGSRNIDFTLKPTTTFPEGSYRVDISANGTIVKSLTFQVQGGTSQATSPTQTSAPSFPPGVYVTKIRINPAQPKRGEGVTFYVTFVNSTGAPQGYKWFVEIYDATKNKGFGQSTQQTVTVPSGTTEIASSGDWKVTGGGPCLPFYAQAQFLNAGDSAHHSFNSTNGAVVSYNFQVCP